MATSSQHRTRMTGPQRRQQLLDATKALALARGFHAVSIEAVARAAGVTRPVVYGHFGDLDGLLEALVERESERATGQLAAVLPAALGEQDPQEALLGAFAGYLGVVQGDPATWTLVLMPPEGAPLALRTRITEGRAAVVALLAQAVGERPLRGTPAPDPEGVASLLSALSDHAARLLLTDPERWPVERHLALARWLLSSG